MNKRKKKYDAIGEFAEQVGMSRAGAFKALEADSVEMWGKYAAFMEERKRRQLTALQDAKARVSNAKPVSKSQIAALVAAQ